jgi:leucyl/phenylalanyl-tRNA--protein transferase
LLSCAWFSFSSFHRLPFSGRALREPNGLLALGGDLSPARLLMAYQRGIFPGFRRRPDFWWSPDPRAGAVARAVSSQPQHEALSSKSPYRVTLNHAFGQVIEGCAKIAMKAHG